MITYENDNVMNRGLSVCGFIRNCAGSTPNLTELEEATICKEYSSVIDA